MDYLRLTDYENEGRIVKWKDMADQYVYIYGEDVWEWFPFTGFYGCTPESPKFMCYEEITEQEALEMIKKQRRELAKLLKLAIKTAQEAHKGQTDRAGVDYFNHLEAVASKVDDTEAKIVAYLHDIIEDTDITAHDLLVLGFTSRIVNAVSIMTHNDNEQYDDYIKRVRTNDLAVKVKKADLRHNMDLTRLKKVTEQDKKRVKKYNDAYKTLTA